MGWFSSEPADTRPVSADNYRAPDRNARTLCWEARDAFFACLDKHDIVDSIRNSAEAEKQCSVALRGFEKDCASSWVTYFKKRRIMEHQREQTIKRLQNEGADVELPTPGKATGARGGGAPPR